jgi:hypothetical protein
MFSSSLSLPIGMKVSQSFPFQRERPTIRKMVNDAANGIALAAIDRATRTRKCKLLIAGGSHGMILIDSVRKKILSTYLRKLRSMNVLD